MADWYYMFNGQQNGPVSGAQLKSLAATGGLGPEDLVWNESMADWVAAQRVKGLNFAKSAPAAAPVAAPRQPMAAHKQQAAAPAPAYAPPPAEPPQEEAYAPPAETPYDEYETAPVPDRAAPAHTPAALAYSQPSGEAVTDQTIEYLRQTRPWVMLVSILLFLFVGLMALFGVLAALAAAAGGAMASRSTSFSTAASGRAPVPPAMAGGILAGLGVVFAIAMLFEAALFFFPALFLMKYAFAIKRLTASRLSTDLETAMKAQKNYWMFIGIVILIVICIYIGLAVVGVASGMH